MAVQEMRAFSRARPIVVGAVVPVNRQFGQRPSPDSRKQTRSDLEEFQLLAALAIPSLVLLEAGRK
jgi:hypothetical protein